MLSANPKIKYNKNLSGFKPEINYNNFDKIVNYGILYGKDVCLNFFIFCGSINLSHFF